ncbi:hypothetical protein HC251_25120 (plasmid) [Iamia sp. SCSIO 61187]|uniref:hypothetical protein n=1 Tax=Iamia sp. SCSIO 61187 TaxID=2722752 RepID=UPI001C639B87|nr:hypothetical protein [Iamia sp. SCSIO 61187]QYG95834.1 hypothetical protein HC251_25120 [Iamia sp. SCSIO 61187]
MTPASWPPLPHLDLADHAAYEWLLSDHPWARAERERRRAAHHARETGQAGQILQICDRLDDSPLAGLADTVRPMAERSALEAEVEAVYDDTTHVADARRRLEIARQVAGHTAYRYPTALLGGAARHQPPPGVD